VNFRFAISGLFIQLLKFFDGNELKDIAKGPLNAFFSQNLIFRATTVHPCYVVLIIWAGKFNVNKKQSILLLF